MKKKRKSITKGLGGPYIHIDRQVDRYSLQEIELYLQKEARLLLSEDLSIHVKVVDGSIKAYVLFGGITIYNLMANYGSLRSGIDHVVKDMQTVSETIIERFYDYENVSPDEVIYKARRQGVPGKIQRYLKKLNKLDDSTVNAEQRVDLVVELEEELLDIVYLLEHEEDRNLVIEASPELISNSLPDNLPVPARGVLDLRFEDDDFHQDYIYYAPEIDRKNISLPPSVPIAPQTGSAILISPRRDDDNV
ncbi:Uncharacterised protein [Zhongshania aliphaticivorans]|uniref:Uncharacterized protein n=1 Tax=Zhongshania aliphaticivorans TaxID=1470434 RepID=A0A5S9Q6G0_9GAMM|nr:hypothetical protein [Zhongshania aliphaticivorans]CAA0103576.1 Uncharacterised protein [Zhongshania aliphaticivorans]CAA0113423.1 Uncharacterised protein [Zhongshania aliphaticivorans]